MQAIYDNITCMSLSVDRTCVITTKRLLIPRIKVDKKEAGEICKKMLKRWHLAQDSPEPELVDNLDERPEDSHNT